MITKAPVKAQGHVFALMARCGADESWRFTDEAASPPFRAALDYLSVAIIDNTASANAFAEAHQTEEWRVQEAAIVLRDVLRYRAYLVEWVIRGKPIPTVPRAFPHVAPSTLAGELLSERKPKSVMAKVAGSVSRALREVYLSVSRRQVLGRNTWTGTSGTVSYYDKDSSPD